MHIIPVIDLMHGQAVHAQLGQRQHYQPIQSLLCNGSAPLTVLAAYMKLYAFSHLYIADLDAITGIGEHRALIQTLQQHYPALEIWLDAGIRHAADLQSWQALNVTHVIGSENIRSIEDLTEISQALQGRFVMSLDFNQQGFMGNNALLHNSQCWPQQLIVMTLNRVGSQLGADIETLQAMQKMAGLRAVYAAGGIKADADLDTLKHLNIAGALVATALHQKKINPALHQAQVTYS